MVQLCCDHLNSEVQTGLNNVASKVPGPISQNGNFSSNDVSSPKVSWFQILFKLVKPFGHKKRFFFFFLQLPIPYCVSLKHPISVAPMDRHSL